MGTETNYNIRAEIQCMEQSILSRMESWERRSFLRGYAELREMERESFSGVIVAGDSSMFMLNGKIVGIDNGRIEDFERNEGGIYISPHPSLPLLFSMQTSVKEKGMQYYTDDKPIEEVDVMLREAEFTGYLELSKNVLSGDYYIVYHRGRSMDVAFIGNVNRLITDEEAREGTKEEVGIYEVNSVGIKPISIPEAESTENLHQGIIETEVQSEGRIEEEEVEEREVVPKMESVPEVSGEDSPREVITGGAEGEKFEGEMEWRKSRVVPSIDPTKDGAMVTALKKEKEKEIKGGEREEGGLKEIIEEIEANQNDPDISERVTFEVSQEAQGGGAVENIVDEELAKEKSNIFIRYKKDDGPTLLKSLNRKQKYGIDAVKANLKYEIHSRFKADKTLVKGKRGTEEVKEYIRKTPEYRFAEWAYLTLPYEIKGTENVKLLKSLYRAIPQIERVRLRSVVETFEKEGDSRRYRFDVIMDDAEGRPLIVANINDDVDPTGGEMITELVESASKVAEYEDAFVAAFLVSSSYHSKETREVATKKIKGKSRLKKGDSKIKDPRVKVSRKSKYYLGLVDCREGEEVHLVFPEL